MALKKLVRADNFKDKVVIVTGASIGVCRTTSLGHSREGAGESTLAQAAHMGSIADLDALMDAAHARFDRDHVPANNAGINVAFGPLYSRLGQLTQASINSQST